MSLVVNRNNFNDTYLNVDNVHLVYNHVNDISKIGDEYLKPLILLMEQVTQKLIIQEGIKLPLEKINKFTVKAALTDIKLKNKLLKQKTAMQQFGETDDEIDLTPMKKTNINIDVLLNHMNKMNKEELKVSLDNDNELIKLLKNETSDQVYQAPIKREEDTEFIQREDPVLTSEYEDSIIISIDSRNRDVSSNRLSNEYKINLLATQGGATRGIVQNLEQVRNISEIRLIDAILPNIKDSGSRQFDSPYIFLDIPEIVARDMVTTSTGSNNRVFGKLRYEFNKDDDVFMNCFTENCFKKYNNIQFLDSLPSITIRLLDWNSDLFTFGSSGKDATTVVSATAGNPTIFTISEDINLVTGNRVYFYGVRQDDNQLITFSAVPTAGTWTLDYDGQTTGAFTFTATAGTIQTALNGLSNLSGVVVTGSYAAGFNITFTNQVDASLLTNPSNTLTAGPTAITITITELLHPEEEAVINRNSGHVVTNLSTTTFSIDVTAGTPNVSSLSTSMNGLALNNVDGGGFVMNAHLQNSFSFLIVTKGSMNL